MKRKICIVTSVLLGAFCLSFAQNIGTNVGIGTSTPEGNLQVKGSNAYDAWTRVYITNNANDYGRTNLILTGRLQDGNDIWRFGTEARNSIVFAQNESASGVNVGAFGTQVYSMQVEGRSRSLGFLSTLNGNVPNMVLTQQGKLGVGTDAPSSKFEVSTTAGGEQSSLGIEQVNITGNPINEPTTKLVYRWRGGTKASINFHRGSDSENGFICFATSTSNAVVERMRIDSWGNVSIGSINSFGYKLSVAGSMIAERIKVKVQSAWPDYVFHEDYKLPPLPEVENYISLYRHLPDLPSAKEIECTGLDVADMNSVLLKKVEELTLYLIEQQKVIQSQAVRIEKLEDTIYRNK